VPWKASRPMDLKLEFVMRHRRGERMSDLCREYGIHRQTGYEIWKRFESQGPAGLLPQSRAPRTRPRRIAGEIEHLLVETRRRHPSWGPKKLKHVLEAQHSVKLPAPSTICGVLKRNGLVERRPLRRQGERPRAMGLRNAHEPNDVWCADYKGQFRLGDQSYCYPLTMTDQMSRFILACDGMGRISDDEACESSANAFRKYGLPAAIRTDNGVPFSSRGLAGLTKLSVFWLRLGI